MIKGVDVGLQHLASSCMKQIFKDYKLDSAVICLLSFTLPLFFYKLGQSSLVSWDEAWYAEIARNILKTGDFLNLVWNGNGYFDHPPVGFWMIALGEVLFGNSEFGVRFASAFIGFLTLVATYFLGKELFNRVVGLCSAIALSSSFWFLYRARSGNLDVFLTFFFVLTFLTALKAAKNKKYLVLFAISFALLILTKTGTPFTIIPALLVVFWNTKLKLKDFLKPLLVFLGMIFIWFISQLLSNPSFLQRYLMIGLPGVKAQTSYAQNFLLAKTYLHDGIGKWFWPGILGVIISIFTLQKKYFILPVFCISFFAPFIFSPKGHIWHLIPMHPFLILSFFSISYFFLSVILNRFGLRAQGLEGLVQDLPRFINNYKPGSYSLVWKVLKPVGHDNIKNGVAASILILFCFYVSSIQLKSAWVQFIDTTKYISDEQILSTEAGIHPGIFYIDDDFGPTAVWYSGKNVSQLRDDDLKRLFERKGKFTSDDAFLVITKEYRLDEQGIATDSYKILKSDRDKILVISD